MERSASSLRIKHTSTRYHKTTMMTFMFFPPAAPYFCKIKVRLLFHSHVLLFTFFSFLYFALAVSEHYLNPAQAFADSPQNATKPNDYCLFNNLITGMRLVLQTQQCFRNHSDWCCVHNAFSLSVHK